MKIIQMNIWQRQELSNSGLVLRTTNWFKENESQTQETDWSGDPESEVIDLLH